MLVGLQFRFFFFLLKKYFWVRYTLLSLSEDYAWEKKSTPIQLHAGLYVVEAAISVIAFTRHAAIGVLYAYYIMNERCFDSYWDTPKIL